MKRPWLRCLTQTKSKWLMLVLSWLCGGLTSCNYVPDPRLFVENQKALKSMENQNFSESLEHLIVALQFDPFNPVVHTNLGVGFLLLQDPDKALQEFKKSEELSPKKKASYEALIFVNRFNQGVVHGIQGRVDEALEAYQKSLELQPESKETKTNIELLMQRQQQQEGGEGQSKDQSKSQDPKDDKNDDKNQKDKSDQDKDSKDKKPKNQEYKSNQKYKPREFKGELDQSDVNKILGEIKSQEKKIRAQYYKSEAKDKPREKNW